MHVYPSCSPDHHGLETFGTKNGTSTATPAGAVHVALHTRQGNEALAGGSDDEALGLRVGPFLKLSHRSGNGISPHIPRGNDVDMVILDGEVHRLFGGAGDDETVVPCVLELGAHVAAGMRL
jgi:hypothetical protein